MSGHLPSVAGVKRADHGEDEGGGAGAGRGDGDHALRGAGTISNSGKSSLGF